MKKAIILLTGFIIAISPVFAGVDSCGAAIVEFKMILKINEFFGNTYKKAEERYAEMGVRSANTVISECRNSMYEDRLSYVEDATYYKSYFSEGLALGYSGKTYYYGRVKPSCWNAEKTAEKMDAMIYKYYSGKDSAIMLYRNTTDILRDASVRAASICEDTRNYDLMGKAQIIYNKYDR